MKHEVDGDVLELHTVNALSNPDDDDTITNSTPEEMIHISETGKTITIS